MAAANSNDRMLPVRFNPVPPVNRLAGRFRPYFDQDADGYREEIRLPLTAEDLRIHGWLAHRLELLHYERYGWWPRLRRLLFENRLVRWLGLRPQGVGYGRTR